MKANTLSFSPFLFLFVSASWMDLLERTSYLKDVTCFVDRQLFRVWQTANKSLSGTSVSSQACLTNLLFSFFKECDAMSRSVCSVLTPIFYFGINAVLPKQKPESHSFVCIC